MPTPPDEAQPQPLPDAFDDVDGLGWEAVDGSDTTPVPMGPVETQPLDAHDRAVLASMRNRGSGIIGFVGAMALIIAICLGLSGISTLDVRVIAAVAAGVVCLLAAVGFMLLKVDGKLQSDLDAGIKLIASGRIIRMGSEEITGPGLITVVTDETPSRQIGFFVEKRLYLQVKPDDIVRMAYVPLSKTILQLRTGHCRYCKRPDLSKGGADSAA